MKSLASIIALTLIFMINVSAQMEFDKYERIHASLTKHRHKNISVQFQMLDTYAQVLNYKEVCKKMTYPEIAQQAGFEGLVQVQVLVDKTGKISKYVIYGDHGELKKEVEKHLFDLEFKPAVLDGEAVSSWPKLQT